MKKKVLSVLLTSAMVMSMAACGEKTADTSTSAPAPADNGAADTTVVAEPAETEEPGSFHACMEQAAQPYAGLGTDPSDL